MFGLIVCVWTLASSARGRFSVKGTQGGSCLCVSCGYTWTPTKRTERTRLVAADCGFQFWRARQQLLITALESPHKLV